MKSKKRLLCGECRQPLEEWESSFCEACKVVDQSRQTDKIRAREAARVLLIESLRLLQIAKDKMALLDAGNLQIRKDFEAIKVNCDRILLSVVGGQKSE